MDKLKLLDMLITLYAMYCISGLLGTFNFL